MISSKRLLSLLIAFTIALVWSVEGAKIKQVQAQFIQPKLIAPQVYSLLPDFPLENSYVRTETGEVDSENTLARRLIRYHIYIKGRSPLFRLDWKLTLADYLGVHQLMEPSQYPGQGALNENPLRADIAAIATLNRQDRDELVGVLVSIFNPDAASVEKTPTNQSPRQDTSEDYSPNARPSLPQPGDADLLMP